MDLIVIGGGPAGLAAAREAGRNGLDVVLLEKEEYPRHKPCGGAVSILALSYLKAPLPKRLESANIFGVRIYYKDEYIERKRNEKLAVLVERETFDQHLCEMAKDAGAVVYTKRRAKRIVDGKEMVKVETDGEELQARYAIIAEGSQGRLKYSIVPNDYKKNYGLCLVAKVPANDTSKDVHPPDILQIHFGAVELGYAWVFPHGSYYSVGVGGLHLGQEGPKLKMNEFLKDRGFTAASKFQGHLIPLSGVAKDLAGSKTLLCGDAGGFVDPFTGEGISYAIRSGQLAAKAIIDSMNGGDLKDYQKRCHIEIGEEIRASLFLTRFIHRYPNLLFDLFLKNPELVDQYLKIPAMETNYKEFLRWLFLRVPIRLLSTRIHGTH